MTTRELLSYLAQHQEQFAALTGLLLEENRKHNLTRITDPDQIRLRHYLDSMAALLILEPLAGDREDFCLIDIGSGAGFPVLPLAIIRTDWRFVSLEATGKKADFQRRACRLLELGNVEVITGRAEDLAHEPAFRERFDAVLARAVADLRILAELMGGFVKLLGNMFAWKGPDVEDELQNARPAFRKMGAPSAENVPYLLEDEHSSPPLLMNLIVSTKQHKTPFDLPRHYSRIKNQPL